MVSQLLFMAGNSLTVGGFFNYFVAQFRPSGLWMAAAMIAPETSQSFSVLGRWLMAKWRNRKLNWIVCLIAGRLASMLLPVALLWPAGQSHEPLQLILGCTVVWYLFQGLAYVNYISWLSDLVPEVNWGALLSRRQMAGLVVSLGMPLLSVWLRQTLLKDQSDEVIRWSYSLFFITGGLLTLCSILPLLPFPEAPWRIDEQQASSPLRKSVAVLGHHQRMPADRWSFRFLLAARWWLAFFQGLTQAVLFKYAVDHLDVSLPTYTVCTSLMILLQLPMAWWAGRRCDGFQEKWTLFGGMLVISMAMLFWIRVEPSTWWLIVPAYLLWGGFGLINVCGPSLCLKLSPVSDNSTQFALYEQVSGLIAGLAGLLGGYLLDRLAGVSWLSAERGLTPFTALFFISWLGRLTAPFWLLPIRQPAPPRGASITDG